MSSEVSKYIEEVMRHSPYVKENVETIMNEGGISLEDAFRQFLRSDGMFRSFSHCPVCGNERLKQLHLEKAKRRSRGVPPSDFGYKRMPLKGLPILEAEKHGFINLCHEFSRKKADEIGMYYGICPECLLWKTPIKGEFEFYPD